MPQTADGSFREDRARSPLPTHEHTSLQLISALTAVWAAIRRQHPAVPPVVLLPAPAHRDQMNVLGHFAALRWSGRREGEELHEVVVVAEHLSRPAEEVAEALLHEAAHALNFERRIKDCSKNQYHNRRFKEAAEELGLDVAQIPHYGFARTMLRPETTARYAAEIALLKDVLIHRRAMLNLPRGPGPPEDDDQPGSRSRKATCGCPFIIRVAKRTIDATTIRCDTCGEPFRLV